MIIIFFTRLIRFFLNLYQSRPWMSQVKDDLPAEHHVMKKHEWLGSELRGAI